VRASWYSKFIRSACLSLTLNSWPRSPLRPIQPLFIGYTRYFTKDTLGLCEAGQSLSCNKVTGIVDCIHVFNTAGGADAQFQVFTASSLDKGVFKFNVLQLYTRRLNSRHPLNRRLDASENRDATFWIKYRTFTPPRIEPQIIGCTNHCLVTTLKVPARFQHVTQTVLLR